MATTFNRLSIRKTTPLTYNYETIYGTPSYTINSFPSAGGGVSNSNDVLVAIDANISSTNDGVLIDLGGNGGNGLSIGVSNNILRARAFQASGTSDWNISAGGAYVEVDISAYTGTLATYYMSVDASAGLIRVYVQPGGKGSTSQKVLLGSDTNNGSTGQSYGSNGKGYGQVSDTVADLGAAYIVTFNGTINQIRYWAESAAYDFSTF